MKAPYRICNPGKLGTDGNCEVIVDEGQEVTPNHIVQMAECGLTQTITELMTKPAKFQMPKTIAQHLLKHIVAESWRSYLRESRPTERRHKAEEYCHMKEAYLMIYGEPGDTEV